jgi:hypothetical protein
MASHQFAGMQSLCFGRFQAFYGQKADVNLNHFRHPRYPTNPAPSTGRLFPLSIFLSNPSFQDRNGSDGP